MKDLRILILFTILTCLFFGCSSKKEKSEDDNTISLIETGYLNQESDALKANMSDYAAIVAKIAPLAWELDSRTDGLNIVNGSLNIQSTEGNYFSAKFDDNKLMFYELNVFGETYKSTFKFYRFKDFEYLEHVYTKYNTSIYMTENNSFVAGTEMELFDPNKSILDITQFIAEDGEVSIIDADKKIIEPYINSDQQSIFNTALEFEQKIANGEYDRITNDFVSEDIVSNTNYSYFRFPLIASIPDKKIYLYGTKDNNYYGNECVLYVGNTGHCYEIPWGTPRFILPQMKLYDFDNDGKEELAIINYYGSGTGISIMGLYIIKINEETDYWSSWPVYSFYPNDYLKQAGKAISHKLIDKSNHIFELKVGGKSHILNFKDSIWEDDYITDILCPGDIVHFTFTDSGIKAEIAVGAKHKIWSIPEFFGTIYADCVFSNDTFTLNNFSFLGDQEKEIEKIRPAVKQQKELFCDGEIVNAVQDSARPEIFILQMNDGFWYDKVYLVKLKDGKIVESRLLTDECVSKANFASVGGFMDFFVEVYYSTHAGNGGLKLFSLDPDVPDFDFYGVYDANQEYFSYTDLQEIYTSKAFSFVYKNDCLDVKYSQPYNDEKCTVSFVGTQLLLDENDNTLDEFECKISFMYDSKSKTMALSKEDCIFPKYWFYNWNAVGGENWYRIQKSLQFVDN